MLTAASERIIDIDAANRGDHSTRPFRDKEWIQGSEIASRQFRQTAVLILGMHRSGTSLLSSLVQSLGISGGDRLIPGDMHNPAGYFEDRECVDIQERMLEALGRPWHGDKGMLPFPVRWWHDPAMRPLVEELEAWIDNRRSSAERAWSLKDPRTTRFLPLWQELLQRRGITPRYLLAVRDPAEMVASEVKRNNVPAERVYRTWLRYNMEALLHAGADLAGVFVHSQWFTDGAVQLRRLAAILGMSVDDDECDAILGRVVRGELRRQHGCAASPPIWASHLYTRLRSLSDQRNIKNVPGLATEAEYFDALLRQGEDPGTEGALTAVVPSVNGLPEALKLADRLRAEGARVVLGVTAEAPPMTASGVAVVVRQISGPTVVGGRQTRAAYALWRWLQQRKYAAVHIEGGEGLAAHCLDARRQGLPDEHGPIQVHYFARPAWLEEDGRLHLHSFAEAEAFCLERRIISNDGCCLFAHPTLRAMLRHVVADEPNCSSSSILSSRGEPLVSICITHHNRPAMLTDCLASVRAQTYRKLEVILVDDGSTQPAARIFVDSLEEEFQAKGWTLVRQENRYLGTARNAAVHAAKGDYLFILDDDNLLMPDGVERAVRIAQHTNADIVTAVMAMFRGPAGTDPTWPDNLQVFPGGAPLLGLFENTFGDANALIRRSCLTELDGFTEDRGVGAEDWEFYAKAALRGYRLEHSLTPLSWYRVSATGMRRSGNWWSDYRRALRAYETVMPSVLRELPALAGVLWRDADALTSEIASREATLAERDGRIQMLTEQGAMLEARIDALTSEIARREVELAERDGQIENLGETLAERATEVAALRRERQAAEEREAALRETSRSLEAKLGATQSNLDSVQQQLDTVLGSTFWRLTGPVRRSLAAMPPGLRRQARRGVRLAYWLVTPHRTRQRIAYLRSRREESLASPASAIEVPATEDPPTGPSPLAHRSLAFRVSAIERTATGAAPAEPSLLAPFFDAEWYAEHYEDVAVSGLAPLKHFLLHGMQELRDPNPAFDTPWYLEAYPDVAREGWGALQHFIQWGAEEGRLPFSDFDFESYRRQAGIAHASNLETYRHYLTHWRRTPTRLGSAPVRLGSNDTAKSRSSPPSLDALSVPVEHGKALYLKRCDLSVFRARTGGVICFPAAEDPFFSVVVCACGNFRYTIHVLELLGHAVQYTKAKKGVGIEVVVIDDGSNDETVRLENYVKGIVFKHVSPNQGFLRACNLGASLASGAYLVFLNNDVEFAPDVFVRLHEAVQADKAEVACFGGAVLQFDGSIQDLGSGLWRDGVAQGYFRNEPPTRYAFAYPRDVDYVAGCFFCIAAAEFRDFGGFDERYSPGYYEESDLALRLWKAGRRSRVYPEICIYHLEFGTFSPTTPSASIELMAKNRPIFVRRHKDLLDQRPEFKANAPYPVRYSSTRLRILFIEHTVPSVKMGSGFGRSEIIVRNLMAEADVDIFACHREPYMVIPEDFSYLDIAFGPAAESLCRVLENKRYDVAYVCRTPNLARYSGVLSAWKQRYSGVVVCDTEAVATIRDISRQSRAESYAAITASQEFEQLVRMEFRDAGAADVFIAVNEFEAAIVRQHCARPAYVIGHQFSTKAVQSALVSRAGIFFLGALDHEDGPNYNGLLWFLAKVWPRIRAIRPAEELRIAGLVRPGISLEPLQRDGVVYLGPLDDPGDEFARARVFVAPVRFAAGISFKVQEALSYGLPVVTSRLIDEQLEHKGESVDGIVAATVNDDGEKFAEACLQLLADDQLWMKKHEAAFAYIARSCAPASSRAAIHALLSELRESFAATGHSGTETRSGGRRSTIDLDQWRKAITLPGSAPAVIERPIGIFVHIFYEDLAEEIADYLARIDLPKTIYLSTGSEEKCKSIARTFERFGLASVSEFATVPNYGYDIAPLLVHFRNKLSQHDICLKVHGKRSKPNIETGERWRKHLYDELLGDSDRARAIVGTMLADANLGVLMAQHYWGISGAINIGPNYEAMQEILTKIDIDLLPAQKIEFPAGSMFWFRSEALAGLARLGLDWSDFGPSSERKDGTLAHAMERCFLFFCASAGKKWGFLPPCQSQGGPKLSRQEVVRLLRASSAFDEAYYRAAYPDVRDAGVDPIAHWVDFGSREARNPSDPHYSNPAVYNLLDYYTRGLPVAASRKPGRANGGERAV